MSTDSGVPLVSPAEQPAATVQLSNSRESIGERIHRGLIPPSRPWAMLFARIALFALCQALFALGFTATGSAHPWSESVRWWPVSATLANLINIGLLARLTHAEGTRMRALYNWDRTTWKRDLLLFFGAFAVLGLLTVLPSSLLALALWGDVGVTTPIMFQRLPLWAASPLLLLLPVSIALAELPTYFGYSMPRLQVLTDRRVSMVFVAAAALAAQHAVLPLVIDWRFAIWRLLMYAPFALFVAWALDRRPTLLPYLMVMHALLDTSIPIYVLLASTGRL